MIHIHISITIVKSGNQQFRHSILFQTGLNGRRRITSNCGKIQCFHEIAAGDAADMKIGSRRFQQILPLDNASSRITVGDGFLTGTGYTTHTNVSCIVAVSEIQFDAGDSCTLAQSHVAYAYQPAYTASAVFTARVIVINGVSGHSAVLDGAIALSRIRRKSHQSTNGIPGSVF